MDSETALSGVASAAVHPAVRSLERWGGILIRPRSTLAALDPREGRHDVRWLVLLYVLGVQLIPTLVAAKSLAITFSLGGAVTFAGSIARTLLGPIIVVVLAEFAMDARRAYRSGAFLVPLLTVGVMASLLRLTGIAAVGPMTTVAVGAAWGLGVVFYAKSVIPPEPDAQPGKEKDDA